MGATFATFGLDGCFLYDDERLAMHLVDLDEYRPGPFTVTADRLPGSSRYMAPEECRRVAGVANSPPEGAATG